MVCATRKPIKAAEKTVEKAKAGTLVEMQHSYWCPCDEGIDYDK